MDRSAESQSDCGFSLVLEWSRAYYGAGWAPQPMSEETSTMFRFAMITLVMTAGLAGSVSASAQQLTEQEARQAAQGLVDQFNKAAPKKDTAAIAARYTEDAIRVTGSGDTLVGRDAIEKWYAKMLQSCDEDPGRLDQVKVVGNDVIVAILSWSGTCHSDKGPVRLSGRAMYTEVRTAHGWKAAASLTNNVPQK
jgi:uncharacterized protein (TIGR02246 family)